MPAYLVGLMEVTDHEEFAHYGKAAAEALEPYGGRFKPLSMTAVSEPTIYEGERPADHMFIIEFESRELFEEFYASPAYRDALAIRLRSSIPKALMVMEGMPLAEG